MFSRLQESELIIALNGRGEIPLKFAYLGNGARHWDAIAQSRQKTKGINKMENELLESKIDFFLNSYKNTKKVNVIDIGCGNGIPTFPIIKRLLENKISCRYVPIDISQEMLTLAEKNAKCVFKNIEVMPIHFDYEQGNFSDLIYNLKQDGSKSLLVFFGSTLGNHSSTNRILMNFRNSMTSSDFLIIGVELANNLNIPKIAQKYAGKLDKDFLCYIPSLINIPSKGTKYDSIWNSERNRVEMSITLLKDSTVKIGNDVFVLNKGEQILLAQSTKFNEPLLVKLLLDSGFRTEIFTTTPDRSYMMIMVQPTKYQADE